jgi:hypothetical protein
VAAAWGQVTGHLIRRLSSAHAAIFAEPSPDPARGTTDWYAEGEGESIAIDDDPAAAARFEELAAAIRAEAERLANERDEGLRLLGELLRQAIEVPGREFIRLRGETIFLVAWGHHRAGRAAPAELVRALPATAAPMAMLALSPLARAATWLWAALAAALLALMLALGLFLAWRDPFSWLVPPPLQCVANPDDLALLEELNRVREEEAALRRQIADAAEELGRRRLLCEPPPEPPRQPQNDDADRARREGAQEGRVQVILGWDTRDDLDLSIVCPDGTVISYMQRQGCGGTLDVDRNVGNQRTRTPVENVYFDNPQPGTYQVRVHQYDHVDRQETPYRVTIRIAGQPDRTITGVARPGPPRVVDRFTIPGR